MGRDAEFGNIAWAWVDGRGDGRPHLETPAGEWGGVGFGWRHTCNCPRGRQMRVVVVVAWLHQHVVTGARYTPEPIVKLGGDVMGVVMGGEWTYCVPEAWTHARRARRIHVIEIKQPPHAGYPATPLPDQARRRTVCCHHHSARDHTSTAPATLTERPASFYPSRSPSHPTSTVTKSPPTRSASRLRRPTPIPTEFLVLKQP